MSILLMMAEFSTDLCVQKYVLGSLQSMETNTETHNCTKYSELETLEHSVSLKSLPWGSRERLQKDYESHCRWKISRKKMVSIHSRADAHMNTKIL